MIDAISKFKDFVPLFRDFLWILFFGIILFVFRKGIKDLFQSFTDRIKRGSSFRIGNVELGENFQFAGYPIEEGIKPGSDGDDREKHRTNIYEQNRGLFLTHVISPSKRKEYKYNIYIYLIRHKPSNYNEINFLDIAYAEFFFGHMWGNEVFKVVAKKGIIGISTSAYAPFLCTCIIKMKDESEIELYRYIDFEAGNTL
jgi:hypothetical protein